MELNFQTFQDLANQYLKYQFELYPIVLDGVPELQTAIMHLHQSNTDTVFSIREIASLKNVNDIYSLSRSMFESVVNMGVLVAGEIEGGAKRFLEFQYVEAYKIYNHLKQIEPDICSKVYSDEEIGIITEGRAAYLSEYGNHNEWCGLNLVERVKLIDRKFPATCSSANYFEYLYCQIYRKGSGAIHRTSLGLGRATLWTQSKVENLRFIEPSPSSKHMVFACIHSLISYLASIRFLGQLLKDKETESYYQTETSRIIAGKE